MNEVNNDAMPSESMEVRYRYNHVPMNMHTALYAERERDGRIDSMKFPGRNII